MSDLCSKLFTVWGDRLFEKQLYLYSAKYMVSIVNNI